MPPEALLYNPHCWVGQQSEAFLGSMYNRFSQAMLQDGRWQENWLKWNFGRLCSFSFIKSEFVCRWTDWRFQYESDKVKRKKKVHPSKTVQFYWKEKLNYWGISSKNDRVQLALEHKHLSLNYRFNWNIEFLTWIIT